MTLCLQNKTYEAEHILTTRNKSIYDANISLHKITAILIIHNAEIKHSTENKKRQKLTLTDGNP